MLRFYNYLFFIFIIFFFTNTYALQTQWSNGIESKVRVISPSTHNNNQNEIYLGLQYKLQNGWKTYWRSPGDGGFPQNIDWSASKNIKNLKILWPTPQEFEILGIQSIGYANEVIFPLMITIQDLDSETFVVLDINYLVCKDICIPGNAHLELIVPPGIGKITEHSYDIEKSLSFIPEKKLNVSGIKNISTEAYTDENSVSILIKVNSQEVFHNPKFYLDTDFGLPVVAPKINYSANYKKISANFIFDKKLILKNKFNLNVILKDNMKAFELNTDINLKKTQHIANQNQSIIYFLFISFIAGLILNVMPCVLPVLSIKLLAVLHNPDDNLSIRKSFIVTSVGIISSFILLALILISLRIIGVNIGWGMQFQQPLFLMTIAVVLFLFTLNLFGFFEFNTSTFFNSKILLKFSNINYLKNFFNGFFATILATPCSAPFVGTAITAAFTQSFGTMLEIFIFMGIGMASPYLLISLFPNMIKILPKPGPWMQWIKYFLGILLLITLIWITSILQNHFNIFYIFTIFILFVLTSIILKYHRNKFLVLVLSGIIFFIIPYFSFFKFNQQIQESNWIDITTIELDDYIQNNNIIFVDITADWCVTCQFNKINIINSAIIEKNFKNNNVIKLRGDWTKPNKKIEDFLNQHNRFGIPLNVMYSRTYPKGVVLSELLSTNEIIATLEKIKDKR